MTKLMLALDVMDKNKAFNIVNETSEYVDAIKIGYPLVLAAGLGMVKEIKNMTEKEIVCDFKVADIPSTNEKIADLTLNYADSIICHGFVGRDSVQSIQNIAKSKFKSKKVIMVTEMSHPGAVEYMQPVADRLAKMAKELNLDGIVAPSTRPERLSHIKKIVGDIPIISPGIGAQGGDIIRVLNILNENDYIIVGRGIYDSKNPKKSAINIKNQLDNISNNKK